MKRIFLPFIIFVGLILGASSAAFAGNAFNVPVALQGWLPLIGTSLTSIVFTLLAFIPSIRNVGFQFQDAILELNKFIAKYQAILMNGEMKQDFMRVLFKLDIATESLALLMGRLGAKKLQTFLSDIIKQDWYEKNR
jgi:hypothetical protein